ncbi:uncharacterized protein LOC141812004 [Curcuma longa]|uniref:uncharacterized protein LOC141812004 n=1 Tax=Curcuma longa TaxID=136217 RepID=UPI003D9E921B
MASKALARLLRPLAGVRPFTTLTQSKLPPVASPSVKHLVFSESKRRKAEFVPVYVALGLIATSTSLGLHMAMQQLRHAPNVLVSKKKRETLPEVVDPDWAVAKAERFISGSIFRRVAQLQDFDAVRAGISDPTREETNAKEHVVTLKTVGVDPVAISTQT